MVPDDEKRGGVVETDEGCQHGSATDDLGRQDGEGGQGQRHRRNRPQPGLVARFQVLRQRRFLQRMDLVNGDVGEGDERQRLEGDVPHRRVAVAVGHRHRPHRVAGPDVGGGNRATDDPHAPGAAAVVVVGVAIDLEVEVQPEGEHRQGIGDDNSEIERMGGQRRASGYPVRGREPAVGNRQSATGNNRESATGNRGPDRLSGARLC